MKEKFKKVKRYLIISNIIWVILFMIAVGIKDPKGSEALSFVLGITFAGNFIIWVIYRIKRKKYRFYTIKENGKEIEIEEEK